MVTKVHRGGIVHGGSGAESACGSAGRRANPPRDGDPTVALQTAARPQAGWRTKEAHA